MEQLRQGGSIGRKLRQEADRRLREAGSIFMGRVVAAVAVGEPALRFESGKQAVLRGGAKGPNYDSVTMSVVEKELARNKLAANIVVDCSHANSNKDHNLQPLVMLDCAHQILEGNQSIAGVMLESNINAGNQSIPADLKQLKYGVSVTDACIDWPTTEKLVRETRQKLKNALPARAPRSAQVRKISG